MLSDDLINIVLRYGEVGRRRRLANVLYSIEAMMTNKPVTVDSVEISWDDWKEGLLRYNICNKQSLYQKVANYNFNRFELQ